MLRIWMGRANTRSNNIRIDIPNSKGRMRKNNHPKITQRNRGNGSRDIGCTGTVRVRGLRNEFIIRFPQITELMIESIGMQISLTKSRQAERSKTDSRTEININMGVSYDLMTKLGDTFTKIGSSRGIKGYREERFRHLSSTNINLHRKQVLQGY